MRAEINENFDFEKLKKDYRVKDRKQSTSGNPATDVVSEKKKFFSTFESLREESRLEMARQILELDAKFIKAFNYDRIELTLDGVKLHDIVNLNK